MHQLIEPVCLIECATIVLAVQTVKASNTRPAGPQISYNNNKTHKNDNKTAAKISLKQHECSVLNAKTIHLHYPDHYV